MTQTNHPVNNIDRKVSDEDVDEFNLISEDDVMLENREHIFVRFENPNIKLELTEEVQIKESKYLDNMEVTIIKGNSNFPGFQLDVNKLSVVKFTSELLLNLDLDLKFKNILQLTEVKQFDESLSYDSDARKFARRLITERGAFLNEDSNFFTVQKKYLTKSTKLQTLRNSRVMLFWRNIELSEYQIKRILTLGLSFLINMISYAELYYFIKRTLSRGEYIVSIKYIQNSYVLIGIEREIFSY